MKKGFTLIELLAVIIILAIIALIATPIILNVIDDARKSAGLSEANIIMSGINDYCATSAMKNQLDGSVDICNDADGVTIEEVSKMVNLGNSKVLDIEYVNDKLVWLQIESNQNIYNLDKDKMVLEAVERPDTSGANAPKLMDNMVPIEYDGSNWIYADLDSVWYNYSTKEWANAVVLNNGVTKNVGDVISESDVALWYVWIPRYTYTIFNGNNETVDEKVINVKFESGTASSGTVKCVDNVSGNGDSSETCTDATNRSIINGTSTYTHPAFTFGSEELTGFWIGKFEISTNDTTCNTNSNEANCNKILPINIKPGVTSFRNGNIANFSNSIKNIATDYNINGDSHMIKNMEWGAVAYLKQSKYGLGDVDVALNNSWATYYTGGGVDLAYKDNTNQSTTGNIYGVYDMSGGSYEFTMGNMVNTNGQFYSSYSGLTSAPEDKYYDKYTYGDSESSFSRGKLGDATKETMIDFSSLTGGWYLDYSYFVFSNVPWFARGGSYSDADNAGLTSFRFNGGSIADNVSSRAILS